MASGSTTNPKTEKLNTNEVDKLRKNLNEATTVLSKYTTVRGKLFSELQEDKARLNSLKEQLKNSEEDFEKIKSEFLKSLKEGPLSNLGVFDGNFDKAVTNATKKLSELKEKIENIALLLNEEDVAAYYDALNKGQDEVIKNILNKNGLDEKNLEIIQQERLLRDEITEVLKNQHKEIATAVKVESQAMRMRSKGWSDIKRGATEAYRIGKDFLDVWGKIDQAASKFAKSIGASSLGMQRLRKNAIESIQKGRFGAKYNVSADELIALQETYSNSIGRNIQISASDQENMAAMFRLMGEGGGDFATKLENFGLSYSDAANKAGKMFKEASKYGITFDKYSKNVATNIKLAQNYTFKNGIKGLESMAKKATAMRLDMQQVANFADKVSTVEGAVNTGAQLQVLGGPFAQFADPMGMLNEGLTNMEGLQDRFEKMIGSLARFNSQTGEMSISAFNKQRIKVAAEAMGMSYDQVMETTMAKGRQNYIGGQIANKGYTKDEETLLKNIATINNGKAIVSYIDNEGRKQDIDLAQQILSKTQLDAIKRQTQSDTDNIRDIATTLRGWDDIMKGTKKQWDNNAATAIEKSGIGESAKGIITKITESNVLLSSIFAVVKLIAAGVAVTGVVNGIGNFFGGGGIKGAIKGVTGKGGRGGFNSVSSVLGKNVGGLGKRTGAIFVKKAGELASKGGAGKVAGKALGKIGRSAAKFGGISALGGALSGVFTGIDEFSGKKNYGTGKKVGRTAGSAIGATIGTVLGGIAGPVGAIAGGVAGEAIGKWVGGGFANQKRRARKIEEFGLSDLISGDYSVAELKKISRGKVERGSKLEEKLRKNGDLEKVEKLQHIKNQTQNVENQTVRAKTMTVTLDGVSPTENMAKGGMLHGPSHSQGGMPILGSNIEVEGGEFVVNKRSAKRFKKTLSAINEMGNGGIIKPRKMTSGGSIAVNQTGFSSVQSVVTDKVKIDPININLNGTIKLEGAGGQKVDISKELLNNPQLISEITKLITRQMNINQHGANLINRPGV